MIDVFKKYIEEGGAGIIATDAAMVTASIGLAGALESLDYHFVTALSLVTSYALSYISNIKG